MTKISTQLVKYFIVITVISICFIAIISNISINIFFSRYIKESRNKDDLKIVQYVEQAYSDYNGLSSQLLMSIAHYAVSESVTVRIKDLSNNILWDSGAPDAMYGMMEGKIKTESSLSFRNYTFSYNDSQIGIIDVGRPKSVIASIEDKEFLSTINGVFVIAMLFSIVIAILSSSHLSRKFLKPIYLIRENARLIEDGNYKKLNKVFTNTLELNELSVSIKELAERLDSQEALRKRLTSDIAHELRTPLSTIQSHIEAFMDGVWEPNPEKLSIIQDEIFRLTKLIKDLSDLSVAESDDVKLYRDNINLSALLENISDSFEPLFNSKNITVYKEIQGEVEIFGDTDRLNQIFINILSNAYKYTNESGNVEIILKQINNITRVTIKDTGIGISNEDIKHVFERFYRSDISRNRGTGGTGIGLTITKALVEAHNGKISIESHVEKGTKVIIEFLKSS